MKRKHFEREAFRQNRQRHDSHMTYPRRHVGCTQAILPPMFVAFSNISGVLWTKTFDTLSEFKRRIRIFSCVVWNGVFSNLNSSRTSRVKRANDELKIPYTYIEKFSLILFFVGQFLSSLSEHHIFFTLLRIKKM